MKIAQALGGDSWGGIDSGSLDRGVGGREGALIRLSREWARAGHEVTNFVTTGKPERIYEDGGGFWEFVPFSMVQTMLATFPYDACVAWECPSIYADPRIEERNPVRLVEMQVAHMNLYDVDATAEFATGVVGLSQWHVDFMKHQGIDANFYVLPNGVDLELYPYKPRRGLPRKPKFFYSSSPDRGLWNLLRIWPRIRKRWPSAELKIAYGTKRLAPAIWAHRQIGMVAIEVSALMKLPGVQDVGQLSQRQLAKIQRNSNIMAYPCDTIAPTETGCITVIEAMAAECPVVTTDCDCLAEEFESAAMIDPLPFLASEYFGAIEQVLTDKRLYLELCQLGREFAELRQWKNIAPRWIELFEEQRCLQR